MGSKKRLKADYLPPEVRKKVPFPLFNETSSGKKKDLPEFRTIQIIPGHLPFLLVKICHFLRTMALSSVKRYCTLDCIVPRASRPLPLVVCCETLVPSQSTLCFVHSISRNEFLNLLSIFLIRFYCIPLCLILLHVVVYILFNF